jgi:predicted transcriptional regulator of viral defense system
MKTGLGPLETRLFAYTQLRALTTVRQGVLAAPLQISPKQESALLGRLARAGLIARVRPGVYLVPPRLPLGGAWSPDEALALAALMKDYGARYQVCGPTAFNRYGLDGQIPNRVYAYNDKISGERQIGTVKLTLIKVDQKRLGDTTNVRNADGVETPYSSRVRTLVDAVYDWSRFDGLPRGYEWIRRDLEAGRVKTGELVACAVRFGDIATRRRIGALLECEGASASLLRKLERTLSTTQSTIPWIPTEKKRGHVDRRWGVVWNEGS